VDPWGSLWICGRHETDESKTVSGAIAAMVERERAAGYDRRESDETFVANVEETKRKRRTSQSERNSTANV